MTLLMIVKEPSLKWQEKPVIPAGGKIRGKKMTKKLLLRRENCFQLLSLISLGNSAEAVKNVENFQYFEKSFKIVTLAILSLSSSIIEQVGAKTAYSK